MKELSDKNFCSGQALMIVVVFLLFISLSVFSGLVFSAVSVSKLSLGTIDSKKSYFLAETGIEDAVYRLKNGRHYSAEEAIELDGSFSTTTLVSVAGDFEIESRGDVGSNIRKIRVSLTNDSGASFNYGVQVGNGGIVMENSSFVSGNVYSNGPVSGFNNNKITGDAVSAGPFGLIDGVYATGTAYAHNISDSTIDRDAYYQTISGTVVKGALHPNSPDQPYSDLPIPDELIETWKTAAAASVVSSPCPYNVTTPVELGPVKILCDLNVSGSGEINLNGPVWVVGDITVENNAIVGVDSSLGRKSIPVIADNPANRTTGSKILLQNNTVYEGSGQDGSYVLMISQNISAEIGGDEKAIEIENNATGDVLLYAGHGKILLKNNLSIREVSAYKVHLQNLASVIYETGLASLLFESGPAGGFSINSWEEVQ